MLPKRINLAILDSHTLFRKTLKNYMSERNMNVIIQSPDLQDLLIKLMGMPVHVLLMEVLTPNESGLEAVHIIKSRYPNIKILILTMCTDLVLLNDLVDAGIYGIVSKTDEPEELERAIVSVAEKKIYRNRLFTDVMYWSLQNNSKFQKEAAQVALNNREQEVLQLLWEEKSNKEIAGRLYLGVRSIEKIRQDLKGKLGVKSTIGLIKYGINKKIIRISTALKERSTS